MAQSRHAIELLLVERGITTRVVYVYGKAASETLPLFSPGLLGRIPTGAHIRATYLMARYAIDRDHLALVAVHSV
jgi:hypothetical protein